MTGGNLLFTFQNSVLLAVARGYTPGDLQPRWLSPLSVRLFARVQSAASKNLEPSPLDGEALQVALAEPSVEVKFLPDHHFDAQC